MILWRRLDSMSTDLLNTTGARIRALMFNRGLQRNDLAAKVGLSGAYVSQLTQNQKRPSVDVLTALADALNTTTDYLTSPATP